GGSGVAHRPGREVRRLRVRVGAGAARPRHQAGRLRRPRRADARHARQRQQGPRGRGHVAGQRGEGRRVPARHEGLRHVQPGLSRILQGRAAGAHHGGGGGAAPGRERRDRRHRVGAAMIRGAFALAIVPLIAACVMIPTPDSAPTSAAAPLALVGGRVQPDPQSAALEDGVVHAVDTGSFLRDTLVLRMRIEAGEIPGPSILTAGSSLAPAGGSPYYVLPARIPEAGSASEAAAIVERELDAGVDVVKLFTGSWARPDAIVVMPVDVVRAAVAVAHRRGKLVIAHPSNSAGARAAIEGGVDILAHTFPSELDGRAWDRSLLPLMHERGMALIPTLKVFAYELAKTNLPPAVVERVIGNAREQVSVFSAL